MKKLWTKFKHWLIKKLGGYVTDRTCTVQHYLVRPETLSQAIDGVRLYEYHKDPKYKEYIDRVLIGKLIDYLYENKEHLICIQESASVLGDPVTQTGCLRAVIKLCPIITTEFTSKGDPNESTN